MIYFVAGACIVLCIVVIVFGIRVLKENRTFLPKKNNKADRDDDEDILP